MFQNISNSPRYWGYHLMLDCGNCNQEKIKDKNHIQQFVKELVSAIDMVAVGEPWIESTAIGIPDKEGFSMYQLIVTSNISAHFVDVHRQIYLDVFSCKLFDRNVVVEIVKKYFMPEKINQNFVIRDAS
jgi:S-adenosylmethionine/arginine decarboxylase-like enzyme